MAKEIPIDFLIEHTCNMNSIIVVAVFFLIQGLFVDCLPFCFEYYSYMYYVFSIIFIQMAFF